MREVTLSGYWPGNEATAQQVLDRTGLWLHSKPEDVDILSLTHFVGSQPVDVLIAGSESITSTKVTYKIKT